MSSRSTVHAQDPRSSLGRTLTKGRLRGIIIAEEPWYRYSQCITHVCCTTQRFPSELFSTSATFAPHLNGSQFIRLFDSLDAVCISVSAPSQYLEETKEKNAKQMNIIRLSVYVTWYQTRSYMQRAQTDVPPTQQGCRKQCRGW